MFWCKNSEIVLRSKFLTSRTMGHFCTNFTRVIFFFIFLFFRIFHLFLRRLNILSTRFRAKMETLHSGLNSWPVGIRGIFVQILHEFFFFVNNFPFLSWTTNYAICKFWSKNDNIVFQSKYLTSRTNGHFHTNFSRVFLFIYFSIEFPLFSETSKYTIYKFSCVNSDIPFWSKFLTCRNLELFRTKFTPIIIYFQRIFQFFLWPLNMLLACFGAKMPTLNSGQNS